jgi:hypothetical protein
MKTFKKLLIIFLIFLISSVFLYLCYSFTYADFNFANWDSKSRGEIMILSISTFLLEWLMVFKQFIND